MMEKGVRHTHTHTHAAVSKTHTRTFAQDLQLTDGPISSVLQSFMMICDASAVKEEASVGKKCDICKASLSVSLSWRKFGLHPSVEHIRWCTRTTKLNNPQSIKGKKKANGVLGSCEKKKKKATILWQMWRERQEKYTLHSQPCLKIPTDSPQLVPSQCTVNSEIPLQNEMNNNGYGFKEPDAPSSQRSHRIHVTALFLTADDIMGHVLDINMCFHCCVYLGSSINALI